MKSSRKILIVAIMTVLISTILPITGLAKTVDEIKAEESAVAQQGESINNEIQSALTEVNEKYQALENLKKEVTAAELTITDTEKEIEETQTSIDSRMELMSDRMKDMQVQGTQQKPLQILLGSDSVSDFISRAYAVTVLQSAEKTKIDSLYADREKLDELKTKLDATKKELITKQETVVKDAGELNKKVTALNTKLTENQRLVSQLATERTAEENRIANEAAAEKAANDKAAAEKLAASMPSEPIMTNPTPDNSVPEQTNPTPPSTIGGRTMNVQATGYSREEGGYMTATGINLWENPWVIAVDPSVIPFGTMVEIPGYGIAIAGDKGSAIKGNIIDLHFKTIAECFQWGRRNVTIKIL